MAATLALVFESAYDLSFDPRGADPQAAQAVPGEPLSLRLVDSGGVGIAMESGWGADYSHARRVFHDVILNEPPFVNATAFERVEREWRAYVEQMVEYGNNAIAVPLLLELIDFDRAHRSNGGAEPIYAKDSSFRRQHQVLRQRFGPLFAWTVQQGMQVFLDADMLSLTPPLSRHLRTVAPNRDSTGIDVREPAVWDVYRAGLEELFDTMPYVQGVVIRFGEGGALYNSDGWPYRSEVAVRSAEGLHALLRGLLPLFEAKHKTLVLRSWTVGVGPLGRLHVDPTIYHAVLDSIDSPALIVSTKYTAGDFFSYLPLNPTLFSGRHRRLVELQAKPEFEGFGAFPNFLGEEYARTLRTLRAANPRIAGTYVLTQFGGPIRAGPRTLYPFHGFWLWTDANVFVASRLAVDPSADVTELARQWARTRFGESPRIIESVVELLSSTRRAVLDGFYIRPFAERRVRVPGLEVPTLMWIFEWDLLGGWHSLLSIVYRGTRDDVDRAIAEGHAAARRVRAARQTLYAAAEAAGVNACASFCQQALQSLEYQETLFEVLAAWRQTFLGYYRWLETGESTALRISRDGRQQFRVAAARHVKRFGANPELPAFDLTSAERALMFIDRSHVARWLASILSACGLALLATRRTWAQSATFGTTLASGVLITLLVAGLIATLTSFASPWLTIGATVPVVAAALSFVLIPAPGLYRVRHALSSLGPSVAGLTLLLSLTAVLGPFGFWYCFWIIPTFRVVVLTTLFGTLFWTTFLMVAARSHDRLAARLGRTMAAAGSGVVALVLILPDWISVLRFLNRPLNIAPTTETMLFALRTYAGVSLDLGRSTIVLGVALLAIGCTLVLRSRPAPSQ